MCCVRKVNHNTLTNQLITLYEIMMYNVTNPTTRVQGGGLIAVALLGPQLTQASV